MISLEEQGMFKQLGVSILYMGVGKEDSKSATVIFQGPEDVLYNVFNSPETKTTVEASGHIYEGTEISRWIS